MWFVILLASPVLAYVFYTFYQNRLKSKLVAECAENYRQQVRQNLVDVERLINSKRNEELWNFILALDFFELQDALRTGALTCTDVLFAFQWRAFKVTKQLNNVTWFLMEANGMAADLDEKYRDEPKDQRPPLYGMPFSVKENFQLAGHPITRGTATILYQNVPNLSSSKNSSLVEQLISLGAIPFVRTNVPSTMLSFTCANQLYGRTHNPFIKDRTPGGSSGGESSLVACGGSAFGISSDLAGSMRMPAHSSGICTLKPSGDRLRVVVSAKAQLGCGKLKHSYGFMAQQPKRSHPAMTPIPYVPLREPTRLRIGVVVPDNEWLPLHPANARVVTECADLLADRHDLVEFEVPDLTLAAGLLHRCMLPDNGQHFVECFKYDPVIEPLARPTYYGLQVPVVIRHLAARAIRPWSITVSTIMSSCFTSISDGVRTYEQVETYKRTFFDRMNELNLDALIVPGFAFPAPRHDLVGRLMAAAIYTGLYNLLDMPAGTVTVDSVNEADEQKFVESMRGKTDIISKLLKQALTDSVGLPVGVQIVTRPYREELCAQVMCELYELVKKRVPVPKLNF